LAVPHRFPSLTESSACVQSSGADRGAQWIASACRNQARAFFYPLPIARAMRTRPSSIASRLTV
jgi:hypothetical protein